MTRRLFCGATGALAAPVAPTAASREHMVSGPWPESRLAGVLLPREKFTPLPTIGERGAWEAVPSDIREAALAAGRENSGAAWTDLPATLFLEYTRNGNRSRFQSASFGRRRRLASLAIAECMEAKGRFLDEIANGVWAISEESFWGIPAGFPNREGLPDVTDPVVELFTGETAALLAWVDYLLGPTLDKVSPVLRRRIRVETDRRILSPCLARDFGWMGLHSKGPANNWNPWICSNWLTAALLLEGDERRRLAAAHKAMLCLDRFTAGYAEDGGCDEGPSYWLRAGGSLFDCLELLRLASGGAIDCYGIPLVHEIGRYIYRAHIAGQWFVNFADASPKFTPTPDLVYRYGRAIQDEQMTAFGAWAGTLKPTERESIGRTLPALLHGGELRKTRAQPPLVRDVWLSGIQVMAARCREGSPQGLYIAAKGGHNAESHNHNDLGNFIVYADGEPVIIDAGVESYTAKTFSAQRYEIWTMQSAYHNCPTIDGVMQAAGRQYAAAEVSYRADGEAARFALNLAKAYPAEAGVRSWLRTMTLDRAANRIEVLDRYALNKPPGRIALTLMAAQKPVLSNGRVDIGGRAKVLFEAGTLRPEAEEIPLEDAHLRLSWGARIYRVLLVADRPASEGSLRIRIEQ